MKKMAINGIHAQIFPDVGKNELLLALYCVYHTGSLEGTLEIMGERKVISSYITESTLNCLIVLTALFFNAYYLSHSSWRGREGNCQLLSDSFG